MVRISPITAFVRSLEGEWFTLAEVARAIGRPEETLRDWARRDPGRHGPDHSERFGKRVVYLYDQAGIERLRQGLLDALYEQPLRFSGAVGRPRIWTDDERKDRERRMARAGYYQRRVRELLAVGNRAGARKASKKARELSSALRDEEHQRRASVRTRMV